MATLALGRLTIRRRKCDYVHRADGGAVRYLLVATLFQIVIWDVVDVVVVGCGDGAAGDANDECDHGDAVVATSVVTVGDDDY